MNDYIPDNNEGYNDSANSGRRHKYEPVAEPVLRKGLKFDRLFEVDIDQEDADSRVQVEGMEPRSDARH